MEEKQEINWEEQYKRLSSDFNNFRRHKEKELHDCGENTKADIISQLLSVADNFELAKENEEQIPCGIFSTMQEFFRILNNLGLERFGEEDEMFNENFHDAIGLTNDGFHPKGAISKVIKKGYMVNNRIIRHAEVLVEQ